MLPVAHLVIMSHTTEFHGCIDNVSLERHESQRKFRILDRILFSIINQVNFYSPIVVNEVYCFETSPLNAVFFTFGTYVSHK